MRASQRGAPARTASSTAPVEHAGGDDRVGRVAAQFVGHRGSRGAAKGVPSSSAQPSASADTPKRFASVTSRASSRTAHAATGERRQHGFPVALGAAQLSDAVAQHRDGGHDQRVLLSPAGKGLWPSVVLRNA